MENPLEKNPILVQRNTEHLFTLTPIQLKHS